MAESTQPEVIALPAAKSTSNKVKKNVQASVKKEGKQIVIPSGMSYAEAITWIQRTQQDEEKLIAVHNQIPCYPLDGSVAVMRALKEIYGFVAIKDTPGFFGPKPPLMVQVPLANGTIETALIGRVAIPKWEGGYIDIVVQATPNIIIAGNVKRKFEQEVKDIITMTKELLHKQSIYKGQSIRLNLSWMRRDDPPFDPVNDAPAFFSTNGIDDDSLILNDVTSFELQTSIFTLIERTDDCVANNIPLKHGALLMGGFGTGKSLTAKLTAAKCVANGWTFIYLTDTQDLANVLRMAKLYAPAVVFAEDVDQAMSGGRNQYVNDILNVIDGVDTKDTPIITILTTNNAEVIEPAFLRAGRIDTIIKYEPPDAATAERFIHMFLTDDDGHSLLEPGANLTEPGKELSGFVPAFIGEAVQKAKRAAVHEHGTDIRGKVTSQMLTLAARALQKHVQMCTKEQPETNATRLLKAANIVGDAFVRNIE